MNSPDLISKLAIDSKSIDDLHLLSKQDSKKALHEAAKQFEALFLQMLVKSMRDATLKSDLLNSQQTQFYTEMYDQQLAQSLSAKGIGLADIMVEQLTQIDNTPEHDMSPENPGKTGTISINSAIQSSYHPANSVKSNADQSALFWPVHPNEAAVTKDSTPSRLSTTRTGNNAADFINTLMPHANNAAAATGIPAHFMLAQAALESGWGKHEIRHPDNSPSHNLFGIKADGNWKGKTIETTTTEYINGVPRKTVEKFRVYNSYEEGFRDYVNFLSKNPRYTEVLNAQNATDFAYGLQRAGYATDPQYADKLLRILDHSDLYKQKSI